MIQMNMRVEFGSLFRELEALPQRVADKVVARALNNTIDQGRTQMAREISREFAVTREKAYNNLTVTHARTSKGTLRLEVELSASNLRNKREGRSMNLIAFVENKVSLAQARRRKRDGTQNVLRVKIKRKGSAKMIRNAFIATNKKSGGTAVFERVGKSRYPIEAKTTIGIPSMFNTRRINELVRRVMRERFAVNFARHKRSAAGGWIKS
ncbi:MAG: phage tail protein [Candidatus Dactylopiibacterium sp.]|nr:phage tail protein [Candidatus Dactylopiibacterium sp.]